MILRLPEGISELFVGDRKKNSGKSSTTRKNISGQHTKHSSKKFPVRHFVAVAAATIDARVSLSARKQRRQREEIRKSEEDFAVF